MKYNEIKQVIQNLALSQGFYGRILRSLNEVQKNDPETFGQVVEELESQNFNDALDVVLYFEQ